MQISRLFHASADAQKAFDELKHAGFENAQLIGGTGAAAGTDELHRHGITQESAAHLAERLSAGAALVIVDPPFGYAQEATKLLEAAGPAEDAGQSMAGYAGLHGVSPDNAAPFSNAFGWPTLSHDPAPLSRLLGMPTLSRSQSPGATSHGFATLTHNPAPLSSALGLPTLTGKAAPLSSALGLSTLSSNAAPLSRAAGMSVLSSNPAPLSRKLGWRELLRDPAPLSRMLGLKVLTTDRHS